jgi:hypothetical protein
LGLSIVYGIVKQWSGFIEVESSLGFGSEFKVYLPRASQPPREKNECVEDETVRGLGTILLVEDDSDVRKLVKKTLLKSGYTVVDAENGGKAVLACQEHPEGFDLIGVDPISWTCRPLDKEHEPCHEQSLRMRRSCASGF